MLVPISLHFVSRIFLFNNQTIFIPSTKKVRVFSINTKTQVLTLMYFPDSSEQSTGSESDQLMGELIGKRNIHYCTFFQIKQ